MRYSACILLLCACAVPVSAGTDAAAFLQAGVGAKALAMGGAFVSVADDTSAIYWNPAGIGRLNKFSVSAMNQTLASAAWDSQKDIAPTYQFFGFTFPVNSFSIPGINNGSNTFGVGMVSLGLKDIPYTYVNDANVIVRDTMEDSENAYFLSYGLPLYQNLDEGIFMGASLKYLTQRFSKVEGASATGYDMDAGLLYAGEYVNLGLVVQRGVSMTWANGRTDSSPLTTKFGASKTLRFARFLSVLATADVVQRKDNPLALNAGAECGFSGLLRSRALSLEGLFLRGGVDGFVLEDRYGYRNAMNDSVNINAGIGLDLTVFGTYFQFDYAFGTRRLGDRATISASVYW